MATKRTTSVPARTDAPTFLLWRSTVPGAFGEKTCLTWLTLSPAVVKRAAALSRVSPVRRGTTDLGGSVSVGVGSGEEVAAASDVVEDAGSVRLAFELRPALCMGSDIDNAPPMMASVATPTNTTSATTAQTGSPDRFGCLSGARQPPDGCA